MDPRFVPFDSWIARLAFGPVAFEFSSIFRTYLLLGCRRRMRRKMTKLCNSYPEYIACVLCLPRVFQTTEEYILGRSEDCLCCQILEWKLQVAKQAHSEGTYFEQLLFSPVDQLEKVIVETSKEKLSASDCS